MPTVTSRLKVGLVAIVLLVGLVLVWQLLLVSGVVAGPVAIAPSPTPTQFTTEQSQAIERAKQYLRDHAKEYSLKPDLSDLRPKRVDSDAGGTVVDFEQLYQGIPVSNGDIKVLWGGTLPDTRVLNSYVPSINVRNGPPPYPGPNAPTLGPTLSAQDAVTRALAASGSKKTKGSPAQASLVIYPVLQPPAQPVYTLVWNIRVWTDDPPQDWGAIIDATTGEILAKGNYFVPEPTAPGSKPARNPAASMTSTPIRPTLTPIPPKPAVTQPTPFSPGPPIKLQPSTISAPTSTPSKQSSAAFTEQATLQSAPVRNPSATNFDALTTEQWCSLSMVEGFEGAFPSGCWTRSIITPTWGTTNFMSTSGSKSAWCAAEGLDAWTDNYANYMNARMIMGPIDLSKATSAKLHFQYWNRSEACCDFFRWQVSTDGNSFSSQASRSGDSGGWRAETLDFQNTPLGDLRGRPQVWVAFTFNSDYSNTDWGAFVDDVWLEVKQANVTPIQLDGWDSPLVPSSVRNTHQVDTLVVNGQTFVDFAVTNSGNVDTGPFHIGLYVDGTLLQSGVDVENFVPGQTGVVVDWELPPVSPG